MLDQILLNRISRKLAVAARVDNRQPAFVAVNLIVLDYSRMLGVSVTLASGRRHAVNVRIEDEDLTAAADWAAMMLDQWIKEQP